MSPRSPVPETPDDQGLDPVAVRRAAMDHLARREHGRRELTDKLTRRFRDADVVEAEVERLRSEGLQSDLRMAEAFVRSRVNRGQGPVRIRMELRQKGIPDDILEIAMEAADADWQSLARTVHDKRFGDLPAEDMKERARRARFLQQRGFSPDHIRSLIEF